MSAEGSRAEGPSANADEYLLEARDLKMHFPIKAGVLKRTIGHVKAVDGVDLTIRRGETLQRGPKTLAQASS